MDIWTVLKACARRWYVFVPVLALTMGFAYTQMQAAPPAYLATSTATLTGPALVPGQEPGEVLERNPFESLGGSLTSTTKVMVALMDSAPKRDEFVDQGVTADYEVAQDESVVYFDVVGDDPDAVVASAVRLVELLDVEMANLQGRAIEAPESRIRAVPVALPQTAAEDPVAGIRVFAVIGALGLIGSVAAALVTDAVMQNRRRRASERERTDRTERTEQAAGAHQAPAHAAAPAKGTSTRAGAARAAADPPSGTPAGLTGPDSADSADSAGGVGEPGGKLSPAGWTRGPGADA